MHLLDDIHRGGEDSNLGLCGVLHKLLHSLALDVLLQVLPALHRQALRFRRQDQQRA